MVAAALVACTSSTEPKVTEEEGVALEGCYALVLGGWSPPPDEVPAAPPSVIELKAERGVTVLEADRRLVRPNPDDGLSAYLFSWWEPMPGDSVSVVWSTGFTGIVMRLERAGEDLRGEAEPFYDYPALRSAADAALERVTCS